MRGCPTRMRRTAPECAQPWLCMAVAAAAAWQARWQPGLLPLHAWHCSQTALQRGARLKGAAGSGPGLGAAESHRRRHCRPRPHSSRRGHSHGRWRARWASSGSGAARSWSAPAARGRAPQDLDMPCRSASYCCSTQRPGALGPSCAPPAASTSPSVASHSLCTQTAQTAAPRCTPCSSSKHRQEKADLRGPTGLPGSPLAAARPLCMRPMPVSFSEAWRLRSSKELARPSKSTSQAAGRACLQPPLGVGGARPCLSGPPQMRGAVRSSTALCCACSRKHSRARRASWSTGTPAAAGQAQMQLANCAWLRCGRWLSALGVCRVECTAQAWVRTAAHGSHAHPGRRAGQLVHGSRPHAGSQLLRRRLLRLGLLLSVLMLGRALSQLGGHDLVAQVHHAPVQLHLDAAVGLDGRHLAPRYPLALRARRIRPCPGCSVQTGQLLGACRLAGPCRVHVAGLTPHLCRWDRPARQRGGVGFRQQQGLPPAGRRPSGHPGWGW